MSSAYGHQIAPMGGLDRQKAFYHPYEKAELVAHWADRTRMIWRPSCSGRDCYERPELVTRYFYVTGRAGRVTDRIQYACRTHGEAFAKKHGLALPSLPGAGHAADVSGDASVPAGPTAESTTAASGPETAATDSVGGREHA